MTDIRPTISTDLLHSEVRRLGLRSPWRSAALRPWVLVSTEPSRGCKQFTLLWEPREMSKGNQPPAALQRTLQAEHGYCSPGQIYQEHNKELHASCSYLYKAHLGGHMVAPGRGLRERSSLQGKLHLQQGHRSSWVRRHILTLGCSVKEKTG